MTVVLRTAYVVYLATVLYLVWEPDASTPGGVVEVLADVLGGWGLPSPDRVVEIGLNVLLFVPLSLLGAFVVGRWDGRFWFFTALAATVLIEMVQGLLLPGRSASGSDVLANTSGALLGLAGAHVIRSVARRRRGVRTDRMAP